MEQNTVLTLSQAKEIMANNNGDLDLSGTSITVLPDNLTVNGFLDLSNTPITALPDNLTVDGSLILRNTPITKLPENLTVGGWLDLSNTPITALPDNLIVGGSLSLRETAITALPENLTVGGTLNLSNTPITELPENLTVGGSLFLSDTSITELPENLTVGGWLDLSHTPITALPDNLMVGNGVVFDDTKIVNSNNYKVLKNGDYVPEKYLYADNILTHIKALRKIRGYVFYQGKIKNQNVIFDGTYYAHCSTFKEGIADLLFKAAKDRGADQYKNLTLDSELSKDDMITMYRIITGACKQGTANFVKSLGKLKEKYTVKEAIQITKGQYHSQIFEQFFIK